MTSAARSLKPYSAYKDSGVEWLGKVPEHWEVKKLKYLVKHFLKYGANESAELEDTNLPRYIRITDFGDDGILRPETFKSLPLEIAKDYLLENGDILFARSGATVGKTFQFKNYLGLACFAGYLIKAAPDEKKVLSDYLYLFTKSDSYEMWKNSIFIQATIQNIGADKYNFLQLTVPTITEQLFITRFLDDRTQKIDFLIEKKQNLIEFLKEERAAVINHAVTKGLDPRAPMRDSGVEWLGEVPEGWEVKKLKYIADIVLGKMLTNDDLGGYFYKPYLRAQNINWQKVNVEDIKQMWFSEKELEQFRVKLNDLLVSEGGEVGRTSIWNNEIEECYIQNSVHKVTMLNDNNPHYFLYMFLMYGRMGYFDSIVSRVSIAHLTREKLKEVICLVPPVEKQNQIVQCIISESANIDRATSTIEKEIALLQEYRTALISEVVTGKIDVRGECQINSI